MKHKKILTLILFCLLLPNITFAQFGGGWDVSSLGGFGLPGARVYDIIVGILKFLLAVIGIAGIIGFAIAGILYLTSAGDEDQIKRAKKAMNYSIIGVVVAIAGYVAIQAADNLLRGNLF